MVKVRECVWRFLLLLHSEVLVGCFGALSYKIPHGDGTYGAFTSSTTLFGAAYLYMVLIRAAFLWRYCLSRQ